MSRHAEGIDPHFSVWCAAEDVRAFAERHLARLPYEPVFDRRLRDGVVADLVLDRTYEPVPETMDGPNVARLCCRVRQCLTNFRDQAGEIRLEHIRRGPELLV